MRRRALISCVVIMLSRVSGAFLFPRHHAISQRRATYKSCISMWDRRITFATTSLQVKHTEDDNRDTLQPLTRTEIRRLKLAAMREELAKRGLDTTGTRPVLMSRLLETVDRVPTKGVKKERREEATANGDTCPTLDPERTYVLRIKGHSNMSYSSSGIGLVLYDAQDVREVWVARKYFPRNYTPFEADYRASIVGLETVFEHGARKIVLQTDNDVIVKQVLGEYCVKKPVLKELCTVLQGVSDKFSGFEITRISSADNSRAKRLAQRAVATKKTIGLPEEEKEEEAAAAPKTETVTDQVVNSVPEFAPCEAEEDSLDYDDEDEEHTLAISPDKTYLLQFDGGSRGNPGVAGSGMVLYDPDDMTELWCGWKYLGDDATNNSAEYYGLLLGIQCARSLGIRKLRAEGDSRLIVNHVTGVYKAREPNLRKLLKACKEAISHLDSFEIHYIPRERNKRADQLANQAQDTRDSFGFDELD